MAMILPIILLLLVPPLAAAEVDALRFEAQIRERHMPYSTIIDPVFAAPDSFEIVRYTRCGDSAIWTGHYLAAEAYRWNVTRSTEARASIMEALNGIRKLVDVTGEDELARCAFPVDSPWAQDMMNEESYHGIHTGAVDGQAWFWVGNTSRDQYLGVFFGLTAAWQLVEDQEVHDWVSMLATRMLDRLIADAWSPRDASGTPSTTFLHRPDQQLAMLKLGRRCNPNRFETHYKSLANAAATTVIVPVAVEVRDQRGSYYKFNLDHIAFYNLLTSGDNWWVRINYKGAFRLLRSHTWHHGNAFFDMIETAIEGRDETRDKRVRIMLDEMLWRPARDPWTDLRDRYAACDEYGNQGCEVIPVPLRVPTDFLWQRSPFLLWGGLYDTVEGAGIDYILPYWMARYHGVVSGG